MSAHQCDSNVWLRIGQTTLAAPAGRSKYVSRQLLLALTLYGFCVVCHAEHSPPILELWKFGQLKSSFAGGPTRYIL